MQEHPQAAFLTEQQTVHILLIHMVLQIIQDLIPEQEQVLLKVPVKQKDRFMVQQMLMFQMVLISVDIHHLTALLIQEIHQRIHLMYKRSKQNFIVRDRKRVGIAGPLFWYIFALFLAESGTSIVLKKVQYWDKINKIVFCIQKTISILNEWEIYIFIEKQ